MGTGDYYYAKIPAELKDKIINIRCKSFKDLYRRSNHYRFEQMVRLKKQRNRQRTMINNDKVEQAYKALLVECGYFGTIEEIQDTLNQALKMFNMTKYSPEQKIALRCVACYLESLMADKLDEERQKAQIPVSIEPEQTKLKPKPIVIVPLTQKTSEEVLK